jgi:AbrB family looped-hinge helix DNA binding protein
MQLLKESRQNSEKTMTMTVTKSGRCTLPKWWRVATGLSEGSVIEIRPLHDGKNSLVLTPKPSKRQGAIGLVEHFAACPVPIKAPQRY